MDRNDFVISLEENAMDSLKHGIEHYISNQCVSDLKYAIIHISHAVELFLKARIVKEHQLLIYSKPEIVGDDAKTVDFYTLLKRLKAANVNLNDDTLCELTDLQKYRNRIQHYHISADYNTIKNIIGKGLRFLETFLKVELDMILKDEVDEMIYNALSDAIHSYEERLKIAIEEMETDLPFDKNRLLFDITYCPNCSEETIVYPDPKEEGDFARCYFCHETYAVNKCTKCGSLIFNEDFICEECWQHITNKD